MAAQVTTNQTMEDNIFDGRHHQYEQEDDIPIERPDPPVSLGTGGFGDVYRVSARGMHVAQKKIKHVTARNHNEQRGLLIAEAEHMLSINGHRHIIGYYSSYECRQELQLGMFVEFANGGDLDREVRIYCANRPNGETRSFFLRQLGCIAVGLEYLHKHPMRHRDIKPLNILIHDGRPKLSDFGAAYNARDHSGLMTTNSSSPVCTPHYMPPEVHSNDLGGRNEKSDIFSLGVTFLEVLQAARYFTLPATFDRAKPYCEPYNLGSVVSALLNMNTQDQPLARLFRLCARMLAWEKEDRPSAYEIVQTLMEDRAEAPRFFCEECLSECLPEEKDDKRLSRPSGTKKSHTSSSKKTRTGAGSNKARIFEWKEPRPSESKTARPSGSLKVHASGSEELHQSGENEAETYAAETSRWQQTNSSELQTAENSATQSTSQWTWSVEWQRYYYTEMDTTGSVKYIWSS